VGGARERLLLAAPPLRWVAPCCVASTSVIRFRIIAITAHPREIGGGGSWQGIDLDSMMVEALISLAHKSGLTVWAEGVENEEHTCLPQ
jgi:hypothetical protein